MAACARPELRGSACWAAAILLLTCFASACPPPRPPVPAPAPVSRPAATSTVARVTPTPTARLEESAIGEGAALTPAPGVVALETPVPTATAAEPAASGAEPESLLTRINSGTAPNVAAALRLSEDARQQMNRGAYDAALDRLERAVAIDPTNVYGYYFLARVHLLKKNYDQAIAFASRAVSFGAHTDRVSLGRIHSLQGQVFEEVGRYPDARKAYQEAIAADPNNLAARVGLARLTGE